MISRPNKITRALNIPRFSSIRVEFRSAHDLEKRSYVALGRLCIRQNIPTLLEVDARDAIPSAIHQK